MSEGPMPYRDEIHEDCNAEIERLKAQSRIDADYCTTSRCELQEAKELITELADALEARLMRPDQSTLLKRAREATKDE